MKLWLIGNSQFLQGIYVIATILLTIVIVWTSIMNYNTTKSFNTYQRKMDSNKTNSSICSIYYDLIFNISQAFKILRYIEKERKLPSDIPIVIMDNWSQNVSNINSVLNYKEIYEINILYKKFITIKYLLSQNNFNALKVQLENLKLMIINKHLYEYSWIDFSMKYEYMFNLKYLSLFHRMHLMIENVKGKKIVDFIDSSVSKQINYTYNDELTIKGTICNGMLNSGTLLIKNDNKSKCINICLNENVNDHIIIYKTTEKLVDADYNKKENCYEGFKTMYNINDNIYFQGELKGNILINGAIYIKGKYKFSGELKNGQPYTGILESLKNNTVNGFNDILNFNGVIKSGLPSTGEGGIVCKASNERILYSFCNKNDDNDAYDAKEAAHDKYREDNLKQFLVEEGKKWIDVKSVYWEDGKIIKEGSINTYEY